MNKVTKFKLAIDAIPSTNPRVWTEMEGQIIKELKEVKQYDSERKNKPIQSMM